MDAIAHAGRDAGQEAVALVHGLIECGHGGEGDGQFQIGREHHTVCVELAAALPHQLHRAHLQTILCCAGHSHLVGQAAHFVEKLVGRSHRAPIHRHELVARLQTNLGGGATLNDRVDARRQIGPTEHGH